MRFAVILVALSLAVPAVAQPAQPTPPIVQALAEMLAESQQREAMERIARITAERRADAAEARLKAAEAGPGPR